MRARLALLASGMNAGVDYEHREVVLKAKPAEMLAASPKGTVPVLVLPTGEVIDQSLDIMLWALRQNDPYGWLVHEKEALTLIARCDGDFKFHLDRYKYPNRYEKDGQTCDALLHRAEAAEFATTINVMMNAEMAENSYAFGSDLGGKYAGCMPFFRQYSHVDKTWFAAQNWSLLQAALASFETSDAFKTIMQTRAPYSAGNANSAN
jgi:glutathione S-transferase